MMPAQEVGTMSPRRGNHEGSASFEPAANRRRYGRWVWRTQIGGIGRLTTKGTKGESKAAVKRRHEERIEDYRHVPRPTRGTLADWLAVWLELYVRDLASRTQDYYRAITRLHIEPHLGSKQLLKLSSDDVLVGLGKIPGASNRRKAYEVLSIALGRAVKAGRIRANVCAAIDPPKYQPKVVEPPTADEVSRILAQVRGQRDEALIVLALATGLRQGELCGLRWCDLEVTGGGLSDSGSGEVLRRPQVVLALGVREMRRGPATASAVLHVRGQLDRQRRYVGAKRGSERTAPVPPVALRALEAHRQRVGLARGWMPEVGDGRTNAGDRDVSGSTLRSRDGVRGSSVRMAERMAALSSSDRTPERDYIFTDTAGRPLTGYQAHDRWQRVLKAAGVRAMPMHAARHLTNSLLLAAGMPEAMVRAVIGHRDAASTQRYTHATDEAWRAATDVLDKALGG